VRAAANPYDPKWEQYFEKRLQAKWRTACKASAGYHTCGRPRMGYAQYARRS
jgi:hypothetical protein